MPRSRLGVALLLPDPMRAEVLGLRLAVGCPSIDTQPPHLTLVPPVNVRDDEVESALDLVRIISAQSNSFRVRVGPVETFSPVSPVLYLGVHGDDVERMVEFRSGLFAGPLRRKVSYEFVPHCTIHEAASPELIASGLHALAGYRRVVDLTTVDVLRQEDDRVWRSLASFPLAEEVVRGRGSVEVSLRPMRVPSGGARELLNDDDRRLGRERWFLEARDGGGQVVGSAAGVVDARTCTIETLVVEPLMRSVGIGNHLLTEVLLFAASRGADCVSVAPSGTGWVDEWLQRRSFRPQATMQFVRVSSAP